MGYGGGQCGVCRRPVVVADCWWPSSSDGVVLLVLVAIVVRLGSMWSVCGG
jgi:hypothetical protein